MTEPATEVRNLILYSNRTQINALLPIEKYLKQVFPARFSSQQIYVFSNGGCGLTLTDPNEISLEKLFALGALNFTIGVPKQLAQG